MRLRSLLSIATVIAVLILAPDSAFARAGGGGGGGGGSHYRDSGLVAMVIFPATALYFLVAMILMDYKQREAAELMRRLEKLDPLWGESHIQARIEATYFAVQNAWTQRNQDLAREFMTDRLYEKHKRQTDAMIAEQRRNVLENVHLIHAKVIGVQQFVNKSQDRIQVHIKGSMIDYHIYTETGIRLSGDTNTPEGFTEIWQFLRGDSDWLLDQIDQDPHFTTTMRCFSKSDAVYTTSPKEELI